MDEDLRRQFEEYQRLLTQSAQEQATLGEVSEATSKALKDMRASVAQDTRALNYFGKEVNQAAKSASNFKAIKESAGATVQSFKGLAGGLGQANQSFSQFSGTVKSVTTILGKMLGAIPFAGEYLDKGARALGEASGFVLSQIDTVAKTYSELGSVGALTIRGVDGLRKSFDELGLVGLPEFADAVKRNSVGIAALGSSTSRGAVQVGKALGQLTDARGPFAGPLLNLGYTLQEITTYGTDYAAMLALSGSQNIRTTEQVTGAMVEYLRQIDEVARATGKSREQINDENKKQQADVKFRAKLMELEMSGRGEEAKALRQYAQYATGPLADAIRASVSGVPLTKEAQAAVALFGGAIQQQLVAIQNGATGQQAFSATMAAAADNAGKFNKTMQYGAEALGSEGLQGQFLDMAEIYRRAARLGVDPIKLAQQERERLEAAGGATKDLTDAQKGIASSGRALQRLGMDFLPAATTAVTGFTTTIEKATNVLRKVLGLGPVEKPKFGGAFNELPPSAASQKITPPAASYYDRIKQLESGGQNIANVPRPGQKQTSAFGLYQITKPTFESLVVNAAPGSPLRGKTFEDMKADPELQRAAVEQLTAGNALALSRRGLKSDDASLYMSHMLGDRIAARVLQAPDFMPLDKLVPKQSLENNNLQKYKTAGELRKHFRDIMSQTGRLAGPGQTAGYAYGGIATGPRGGYVSVLHGTEAVVPLPDGRTIPVSMPADLTSGIREQVGLLAAQLSKMDEMIGAMRNQTAVSQKILQHSTS